MEGVRGRNQGAAVHKSFIYNAVTRSEPEALQVGPGRTFEERVGPPSYEEASPARMQLTSLLRSSSTCRNWEDNFDFFSLVYAEVRGCLVDQNF